MKSRLIGLLAILALSISATAIVVTASGVKDNASEKENSSDSAQKPVVIPTIEAKSFASGITSNELLAWTKAAIA